MRSSPKWVAALLKIAITASILAFLASRLPLNEIPAHFTKINGACLVAAWLVLGLAILISNARWKILLYVQGIRVGFGKLLQISLIGQFFNAFLLGATGGDIVMISYVMRETTEDRTRAGFSVVVDRFVGIASLLVWMLVTMPFLMNRLDSRDGFARIITFMIQAAAVGLLAMLLVVLLFSYAGVRAVLKEFLSSLKFGSKAVILVDAVAQHFVRHRAAGWAVLVGLVVAPFLIGAAWFAARAIGLNASYGDLLAVLPLVFVISSLPISLGGLGPREGIIAVLFPAFGIVDVGNSAFAVTFSLLWYFLTISWSLVGAMVYLSMVSIARAAETVR